MLFMTGKIFVILLLHIQNLFIRFCAAEGCLRIRPVRSWVLDLEEKLFSEIVF